MALSLYEATVPQLQQVLTATITILGKAEEWAKEQGLGEEEVLGKAICADMWPLAKQFQVIAGHSAGAIKGAMEGKFSPNIVEPPMSFAALRALLDEALATLAAVTPADLDGLADQETVLELRGQVLMRFKGGDDFLLSFAQPNFYFHVTAAYAILRGLGMPIGKRDYMGMPRIIMPA